MSVRLAFTLLAALLLALAPAAVAARAQEQRQGPYVKPPPGQGAGAGGASPRAAVAAPAEPPGEATDCVGPRGVVRLRAVLSANGQVTNITVLQGLPDGLTEKAIEAARQIKFRPAQKDGRVVSQWVTLEYNFRLYHMDEGTVTRRAVILEQPAPVYTAEARRQKVAGKVVLDVFLCGDGEVAVDVVEGLPHGLTEQAIEAARRIRFTPAEDAGKKVTVRRRVEYVFSLD